MRNLPVSFLCVLVLLLGGCSASKDNLAPEARLNIERPQVVEVISPRQQALVELQGFPTSFAVPFHADMHSWERAELFLRTYTGDTTPPVQEELGKDRLVLKSPPKGQGAYSYMVVRRYTPDGYEYSVRCDPRFEGSGSTQNATLNARNLARFVKDGNLELSLVSK